MINSSEKPDTVPGPIPDDMKIEPTAGGRWAVESDPEALAYGIGPYVFDSLSDATRFAQLASGLIGNLAGDLIWRLNQYLDCAAEDLGGEWLDRAAA